MGRFSRAQLKEIALGLEKSEQRFLWVVRTELEGCDDLVQILSHDSVGGFVTHCGWNLVLEAMCEGVPMVVWPLYTEQKMNRVILVKEIKVALAVNENKEGFVSVTELVKGCQWWRGLSTQSRR
ncbi:hypothetical protein JHK82_024938 [Glycine max]|nr:hypothetical protein JHK82_024938 [Glycine max]